MAKAIAKANQNEIDQYEKHCNTAYSVSKSNQLILSVFRQGCLR
jgi:hypothetical protein